MRATNQNIDTMYYHIAVTNENCKNLEKKSHYPVYELNITEMGRIYEIVRKYYRGEQVQIKKRFVDNRQYPEMMIVQSEETAEVFKENLINEISKKASIPSDYARARSYFDQPTVDVIMNEKKDTDDDITLSIFDRVSKETKTRKESQQKEALTDEAVVKNKRVFIVHGHDDELKESAARLVEKIGLEAIILNEQANEGQTIIHKLEKHADVGYAIILYTPCDEGRKKGSENSKPRARQNVVFEHGLFMGKLGAGRVCALRKSEVEMPSDAQGILYIEVKEGSNEWKYKVAKELKNAGYDVDSDKI